MRAREPLALDPTRGVAIKRSVHEIEVDAPAEIFARAFMEVLGDPEADFGGLRVRRARAGAFVVGERFRGALAVGRFLPGWVEENFLSDHCELIELTPMRARYRYLDGTPIAGQSTLEITPLGPARCRLTQTFEYQERGWVALFVLQRFGVALHDRAFVAQARQAAGRARAHVILSTVPGS